jgi:hypothetical protein
MKILDFFLFLWVIFTLLDPDPDPATQINADPDPEPLNPDLWVIFALLDPNPDHPATQSNVDPCGSRSGTITLDA